MIPYTIERRPDTGVSNITMGIWLLVGAETMLFGALWSSYALLRTSAAAWPANPDALVLPAGLVSTGLMALAAVLAWRARRSAPAAAGRWLAGGALAALAFLIVQAGEYIALARRGLAPSTDTWLATYFTMTGVHGMHVLCGAIANVRTMKGAARAGAPLTRARAGALVVYWTFVAIMWLGVFTLFYLA